MNPIQKALCMAVRTYQLALSPVLSSLFGPSGLGCRYSPTCSAYALEAIRRHGAIRGCCMATGRLCRCHPWGSSGLDPVPGAFDSTGSASRVDSSDAEPPISSLTPASSSH